MSPHFTAQDLAYTLLAIALFPVFLWMPGYTVAWLLDLFHFRRRTWPFRAAFSLPLSIALCPILTYLAGRFFGPGCRLDFLLRLCARMLRHPVPQPVAGPRSSGAQYLPFAAAVLVWLAILLYAVTDFQVGDRLYYATNVVDNSVRSAFIHSISTTGIPPQNPFFLSGGSAPLRYHYFWFMMCSLVDRAGGGLFTARHALNGGIFWCGLAIMALVALYLRLVHPSGPGRFHRRALNGILLLGITGLDLVPCLFLVFLYTKHLVPFILPSIEAWNEDVDWFLFTAIWAPHALSSLISCLTAFLLLWNAPAERTTPGELRYAIPAGAALASAAGESIYVAFVFAAFLCVWTAITLIKKWRHETLALLIAGAAAVVLVIPYLASLRGPAAPTDTGSPFPLSLAVRAFSFAPMLPGHPWHTALKNLSWLPLNYLLEFGFFFLAGRWAWQTAKKPEKIRGHCGLASALWQRYGLSGRNLSRTQLAFLSMAITSLLICTFVRSNIGCNDLGWRGLLPAEFILLLCGADMLSHRLTARLPIIFLALGIAGTVCDLALSRTYALLVDREQIPSLNWMGPAHDLARRAYAARSAYQWLRANTPPTAVIQFNPKVEFEDAAAMLYSDRRMVAVDMNCNVTFGGDPQLCPPILTRIQEVFPASAAASPPSAFSDVCRSLPIDILIAKDTDPAWRDPKSWVWNEPPIYANHYLRLFSCHGAMTKTTYGAVLSPAAR